MNSRLRRRLFVVGGIVVITVIVIAAVFAGTTGSQTISVAEAASGSHNGKRVQVTGQVVDNSFSLADNTLEFVIYDSENPAAQLRVSYEGAMSASFGNQVTAICTGTMSDNTVLICTELVTKCPSKYESATDALEISQLLEYGDAIVDVSVRVRGSVKPGSVALAGSSIRLVLVDPATGDELSVAFSGGLPDTVNDSANLVVTGSLGADGLFHATDIAVEQ